MLDFTVKFKLNYFPEEHKMDFTCHTQIWQRRALKTHTKCHIY